MLDEDQLTFFTLGNTRWTPAGVFLAHENAPEFPPAFFDA
jgi:hypothetical protein